MSINNKLTIDFLSKYWVQNEIASLVPINDESERPDGYVYGTGDPVIPPDKADLARLHALVRSRKVTTVLEIGVGFSTAVLAHAIFQNRLEFESYVSEYLRRSNAFEIHSVDAHQKFIDIAKTRINKELQSCVTIYQSDVEMSEFGGRICSVFKHLPNVCPDLIYLDGPDQFAVSNNVGGISTAHPDRLPMSADLLRLEHFLLPGTLIIIDGRAANARFLRCNFQRDWHYEYDEEGDVHFFELVEPPLGKINARQIEFCLGSAWLAKVLA